MKRFILPILLDWAVCAYSQIIIRPLSVSSTLSNSIVAHYSFEETEGTRYDATDNNNDLTDYNTVAYATGVIGNAADFEYANGMEYLGREDNASLSFGAEENFCIAFWWNAETSSGDMPLVAKTDGNTSADIEYRIYSQSLVPKFATGNGTNATTVTASSNFVVGTWVFVCAWYNTTTDSIYIQINDGAPNRAAAVYEPHDGTDSFWVGYQNNSYYGYKLDGQMDELTILNRCPVSSNGFGLADSLYNGGLGWRP